MSGMTIDEAREVLAEHGYTPGISSTSGAMAPDVRRLIKRACRALADAGASLTCEPPPPPPGEDLPRTKIKRGSK